MNYSSAPIEGTPFTIFKTPKGYCATMGRSQITDYYETEKAVLEQLPNKKQMRSLIAIMSVVANNVYETREIIKTKNENDN